VSRKQWDCEVSISFGRKDQKEDFSFTLFLRLVNPELEKQLGERIAYKPEQVDQSLRQLSSALQSEGKKIIDGDDTTFEKMKSVRWWDFDPDAVKKKPPNQ
jgi:hypothetical protein